VSSLSLRRGSRVAQGFETTVREQHRGGELDFPSLKYRSQFGRSLDSLSRAGKQLMGCYIASLPASITQSKVPVVDGTCRRPPVGLWTSKSLSAKSESGKGPRWAAKARSRESRRSLDSCRRGGHCLGQTTRNTRHRYSFLHPQVSGPLDDTTLACRPIFHGKPSGTPRLPRWVLSEPATGGGGGAC
jgi:hypothetical protein